jgi:transposase
MSDARQIPDEVMTYLRHIAVRAINENGYSPEDMADVFGISRSSIYDWLRRFNSDGYEGLQTRKAPGAPPVVTGDMDQWLKKTILEFIPEDFGYDTPLWTCDMLAQLLPAHFGVTVIGATVNQHLKKMSLSYQKPQYRPCEQNPDEVDRFLSDTFPRIQRLANKIGAEIGFEDEAGVDLRDHSGRTWGKQGEAPRVHVTGKRGRYNVLSVVTATGNLRYEVTEKRIDSQIYIDFLTHLLQGRDRPLILIADRASFHYSKAVCSFVRTHRQQLRIYFLPSYSPELNPDEHVWEEIKDKQLGRQSIKSKLDLKEKLNSALKSLQENSARLKSFFLLPDTKYADQSV